MDSVLQFRIRPKFLTAIERRKQMRVDFFRFPHTKMIISTEGLQRIEMFTLKETLNSQPYIEFVYNRRATRIDFQDDDTMLNYFAVLEEVLGVEIIEKSKNFLRR